MSALTRTAQRVLDALAISNPHKADNAVMTLTEVRDSLRLTTAATASVLQDLTRIGLVAFVPGGGPNRHGWCLAKAGWAYLDALAAAPKQ